VATWWETAEWVARLSPSKGAKAFFIQHHEVFPGQPVARVEATWRLPLHKITIARWLVDLARDRYGDADVSLVENSVDTEQFRAPARGKQARPSVGYLYAATPIKGPDVAMRSVERLKSWFPDLRVACYGMRDPTPEAPIPAGAEFTRLPAQDQLPRIYASVDVWLVPSRGEGFHLPPLEAMACGTPVVASRVGGAVETVADGVNGYLADVEDDAALAEGCRRILALDEAGWRRMSDAALARARSYTWDDATALFEAALRSAIERGPRAAVSRTLAGATP
jgi:glycosyltransferase involved in cell wall biosynthesis